MNTPSAARMKEELIISLRSKVFGDRGTDLQAAWDYVETVINGMDDSHNRGPAWTAVHVLANTIANVIETLPEFLPAPPDEVRISPEDNPAAGAAEPEPVMLALDRAALDQIIDARIANWYEHEFDIDAEIERGIDNYDFTDTVRDTIRHNISFSVEVD